MQSLSGLVRKYKVNLQLLPVNVGCRIYYNSQLGNLSCIVCMLVSRGITYKYKLTLLNYIQTGGYIMRTLGYCVDVTFLFIATLQIGESVENGRVHSCKIV